jgi:hypothetical protein
MHPCENTLPTQVPEDEASIVFHNRCGRVPSKEAADEQYLRKGVKRVVILRRRMRFMGTKVGPDVFILNLAGSVGGPYTVFLSPPFPGLFSATTLDIDENTKTR